MSYFQFNHNRSNVNPYIRKLRIELKAKFKKTSNLKTGK